jgi:hypothetical protein
VLGGRQEYLTGTSDEPYDSITNEFSCAACLHCTFLCEMSVDTIAGPAVIEPLPADWAHIDYWPTPVAYFESLNHEDFWNVHAKRYSDAIKVGPKIFGVRMLDPTVNSYTQVLEPLNDADKDLLDLDPSMSPPDLAAANFENDRRIAARKIRSAAIQTKIAADARAAQEVVERDAFIIAAEAALVIKQAAIAAVNQPPTQNVKRPSLWYMTEYSNSTEGEDGPNGDRYEENRRYILANRAQGRLCLDTMYFVMPENTLLNHIRLLGGLQITTKEWRDYLRIADDRQELFAYVL